MLQLGTYLRGLPGYVSPQAEHPDKFKPLLHAEHHGGPASSRGRLLQGLDSAAAQEHQLEIGICGASREDGEEILQVPRITVLPLSAPLALQASQ